MKIYSGKHDVFGFEKNDCAVRCLANLTGMSYPEAHGVLKKAGRLGRKPTEFQVYYPVFQENGIHMISIHGFTEESLYLAENLTKVFYDDATVSVGFCVENLDPEKSYAILTTEHIFSFIRGVIYDKTIEGGFDKWKNIEVIGVMEVFA